MGNKTGLITPFLMLLAGAIASIIMYVRGYELTRMLWGLLIVLLIFYVLGDIARYLYASIRPRIIPTGDLEQMVQEAKKNGDLTGNVVAFANEEQNDMEGMDAGGFMSEDADGYSDEEIYDYSGQEAAPSMEYDNENPFGDA
ncbi:MAG: hypothetical protein OSJ73_03475 [Lachnospiraceae bacterium]|jgi:hypothetical protein|nr:hypothetical protein [Lachnospiraceae bacterium]HBV81647.1 hypothetical protein [Lachnospiraceae bacterium]